MFEIFSNPSAWIALVILILIEILISIDNIVFISFASEKLESGKQKKAIFSGFAMAAVIRIILLIGFSLLLSLKKPFYLIDLEWITGGLSVQGVVLFLGGLFLLIKGTKELREKVEDRRHDEEEVKRERSSSFSKTIIQLLIINMVFSLDSALAAIGMTTGISSDSNSILVIMIIAALIALLILISFAKGINSYIEKHPSIKVFGLAFLMIIGFIMIADAAQISHITLFKQEATSIHKGYLYFAIAFCSIIALIELIRKKKPLVNN